MYSDSDDGGCAETRKSTSAGALMHGSHLIKFYSGTQHTIALSSEGIFSAFGVRDVSGLPTKAWFKPTISSH